MTELEALDRAELMTRLTRALPEIRSSYGLSLDDLERATGIGVRRLKAFEEGRQAPKWSEYLTIIFVLWSNESSRPILDEKGLFPMELKRAFSVNRNAHE